MKKKNKSVYSFTAKERKKAIQNLRDKIKKGMERNDVLETESIKAMMNDYTIERS